MDSLLKQQRPELQRFLVPFDWGREVSAEAEAPEVCLQGCFS